MFRGLLFDSLASFGFGGQCFLQPLDLLIRIRLGCLQFLGPRLQPGLFGGGILVMRQVFLLCVLQLLVQLRLRLLDLRKFSIQRGFPFGIFASLLFGVFSAVGFRGQRFC